MRQARPRGALSVRRDRFLAFEVCLSSPKSDNRQPLVETVVQSVLKEDAEFRRVFTGGPVHRDGQADYLFAAEEEAHEPAEIFGRLRWGGQFLYASPKKQQVEAAAKQFAEYGFRIVRGPAFMRMPSAIAYLAFLGQKVHYFVTRKVLLI